MYNKETFVNNTSETDKELKFTSDYFEKNSVKTNVQENFIYLFSAAKLLAEQFSTVTVQQDSKNIVLAIPYTIINFQQQRKNIIDRYYRNNYLQQQLLNTTNLKNKIFQITDIKICNIPLQDLETLNGYLQSYGYLESNNKNIDKILLLKATVKDLTNSNTEKKQQEFQIALPVLKKTPASNINTVTEFKSVCNWVESFDPLLLQNQNNNIQKQKLTKLENVYNKIINLEKQLVIQNKKHININNNEYLEIHITDVQQLRKKIEKKYFQVYIPLIKHLEILENIEKKQKFN